MTDTITVFFGATLRGVSGGVFKPR